LRPLIYLTKTETVLMLKYLTKTEAVRKLRYSATSDELTMLRHSMMKSQVLMSRSPDAVELDVLLDCSQQMINLILKASKCCRCSMSREVDERLN
jgi:hypothetical protein